ncbi:MAG: T9SS type A sorting domain-containing protein [Bacteroidetes bacterium]|nr:T9SS type A sorting domain-containing protein [Bacteroidota bacterium]
MIRYFLPVFLLSILAMQHLQGMEPEVFNVLPGETIQLEVESIHPVRWEASTDGITWVDLVYETDKTISVKAISDKYYRAVSLPENCDPVVSRTVYMHVLRPLPDAEPQPIGVLKPFWRNHPVLGPYLQDGLWLDEVPDYFLQTDFPYPKRSFEREVLFADHLSVVRFLGGTNSYPGLNIKSDLGPNNRLDETDTLAMEKLAQYDFVYRNPDGTLAFRPELVEARLGKYIENGYESFTIVLDNIPYCLTNHPEIGSYGQAGPPDDPEEWYETIRQLCFTLTDLLGPEKANKLRFRIGTEMNGTERFAGTEEEFITHFDYAAAAIKDVFPGAVLSLHNISGASVNGIENLHNVNAFRVMEHASTGANRKTGEANTPVSFVAASRYYYEGSNLENIVSGIDEVWDHAATNIPGNDGFTREIHEFGAIGDWGSVPKTTNPDAFGNAMNLQVVIGLIGSGIDRLFLWNMLENVKYNSNQGDQLIPSSMLWGYSVLEYMKGGHASIVQPSCPDADVNTTFSGLISVFEDKAYLMVNSFNPDRTVHDMNEVTVRIPRDMLPFIPAGTRSASMNNEHCIYQSIRKSLDLSGNLKSAVKDRPEVATDLSLMSKNLYNGRKMVSDNWNYYITRWKNSLMLTDFEGSVRDNNDAYYITLNISSPESTVILLEAGGTQQMQQVQQDQQAEFTPRATEYFEDFTGDQLPAAWPESVEGYQAELENDTLVLKTDKNAADNVYHVGPLWIENFDFRPYCSLQYRCEDSLQMAVRITGPGGRMAEEKLFSLAATSEWKRMSLNLSDLAGEELGFHLDSMLWVVEPAKADYSGTLYINEIRVGASPQDAEFGLAIEEPSIPLVDLGRADTILPETGSMVLDAANEGAAFLWSTGETTRTIQVDTAGLYWVSVIGEHNCTAADTIRISNAGNGFRDLPGESFSVDLFPNPAEDRIYFRYGSCEIEGPVSVVLMDLTGKVISLNSFENVLAGESYGIDVSAVSPGLYLIRVESQNRFTSKKIAIQ